LSLLFLPFPPLSLCFLFVCFGLHLPTRIWAPQG
jgi:hypothetical protein